MQSKAAADRVVQMERSGAPADGLSLPTAASIGAPSGGSSLAAGAGVRASLPSTAPALSGDSSSRIAAAAGPSIESSHDTAKAAGRQSQSLSLDLVTDPFGTGPGSLRDLVLSAAKGVESESESAEGPILS